MLKTRNHLFWITTILLIALLALTACQAESGQPAPAPTDAASPIADDAAPTADEPAPTATSPPDAATPIPPTPTLEVDVKIGEADISGVTVVDVQDEQVTVLVSGEFRDGCTSLEDIAVSYADQTFAINLITQRPADAACTQQVIPFNEEVTLDVSDLGPGEYIVESDGVQTVFTLGADATPPPADDMDPTVSITPTTGGPGTAVTLTASPLAPNAPIQIGFGRIDSEYDIIETAETNAAGELNVTLQLPDFAGEPGEWVFVIETADNTTYLSNTFTVTGAEAGQTTIYLVALEDDGQRGPPVGCGDSLVPIPVEITSENDILLADALQVLLEMDQRIEEQSGLYNALHQSDLSIEDVTIENGQATVSLTGALVSGGACDVPRIIGQLRQTALQFDNVDDVTFLVNDDTLDDVLNVHG